MTYSGLDAANPIRGIMIVHGRMVVMMVSISFMGMAVLGLLMVNPPSLFQQCV